MQSDNDGALSAAKLQVWSPCCGIHGSSMIAGGSAHLNAFPLVQLDADILEPQPVCERPSPCSAHQHVSAQRTHT